MPIKRLSQMSLTSFQKHSNLLAGNPAYDPPAFELLQTTILSSSASSVTFSSIVQTYKHLQIRMVANSNNGSLDLLGVVFNNVTSASYASHAMRGDGSSVSAYSNSSQSGEFFAGVFSNATTFGASVIDILDYSSTSKNTTARILTGVAANRIELWSGLFNNTNAITQIQLKPINGTNFLTGSRFSLYGIR